MSHVVVVQARMGSTRLPGKVLMPLAGIPVLALVLRRLRSLGHDPDVVVATSDLPGDDPVVAAASAEGIEVARGSEHDVLGRIWHAVLDRSVTHVVRITADCPFIDPALVAEAIDLAEASGADYVSNSLVRTYPDGLDVEVITSDALAAAQRDADRPFEREHVTPHLYRRPDRYSLVALTTDRLLGAERWTLDDHDDLVRLSAIAEAVDDPISTGWVDILPAAGIEHPISVGTHLVPVLTGDSEVAPSTPACRTWRLTHDGRTLGWVMVSANDGVGTVSSNIPDEHASVARSLLERHLAADLQVDELVEA